MGATSGKVTCCSYSLPSERHQATSHVPYLTHLQDCKQDGISKAEDGRIVAAGCRCSFADESFAVALAVLRKQPYILRNQGSE